MKNLFLIKNCLNLFSLGKDSVYCYFKWFYKKKNFLTINFYKKNIKNYLFNYKKKNINFYSCNELIFRKIKFSLLKKENNIIISNHHFLDKIENFLNKIIIKKKNNIILNNWFFKKKYFVKPLINYFIKNYNLSKVDNTNKFIFINRNFIRSLFSYFLKKK